MRRFFLFGVVCIALFGLVAATPQAGESSYEALVKDMLGTIEEITKTLNTIKDASSAAAARPELKKAAEHVLVLRKKAEQWKQPNKEEKDRLEKEYAPKMEIAVKKLREASVNAKGIQGAEDAVAELAILADFKDQDKKKKR